MHKVILPKWRAFSTENVIRSRVVKEKVSNCILFEISLACHIFSREIFQLNLTCRGVSKLLASKFTLGAEGSVAAGPIGRTATAQTDAQMHAEILSWSRSQGLFAGLALQGATLRQDLDDNATLYGSKLENRTIVTTDVPVPASAVKLLALLNMNSPKKD